MIAKRTQKSPTTRTGIWQVANSTNTSNSSLLKIDRTALDLDRWTTTTSTAWTNGYNGSGDDLFGSQNGDEGACKPGICKAKRRHGWLTGPNDWTAVCGGHQRRRNPMQRWRGATVSASCLNSTFEPVIDSGDQRSNVALTELNWCHVYSDKLTDGGSVDWSGRCLRSKRLRSWIRLPARWPKALAACIQAEERTVNWAALFSSDRCGTNVRDFRVTLAEICIAAKAVVFFLGSSRRNSNNISTRNPYWN